ncbi:MAG TPA: protease pro-enzyme activation domain-containing protein, partial [Candidatus Limnocylindrales bacterium]
MVTGRRIAAALATATLAITMAAAPALAASGRATLVGSVPSWATAANFKGATSTSVSVGFRVYLGWNNESAAAALAAAVSDPKNTLYGHYLTPAQFRLRFAPTQAQIGAVQAWLRSQGFTVDYTPSNNPYVAAEGTVGQAAAAFGTTFGNYSVRGLTVRSPERPLTIPSSLAGSVVSVLGLDDSALFVHTNHISSDSVLPG